MKRFGLMKSVSLPIILAIVIFGGAMTSAEPAIDEAVLGNNTFAFDLFAQIAGGQGNIFISPYSISSALAMAYAGAKGDTASQMADVLKYIMPQEELHKAFGQLNDVLNEGGKDYQLSVANALWSQKGLQFKNGYLETVQEHYGSGLKLVDFANKTEEARLAINAWVEQKTENKIIELIKPNVLDNLTRLVLTNAIYFKGQWDQQFKKELTQTTTFNLNDKDKVEVPFMNQQGKFRYAEGKGFQAVELPYAGGDLSMVVILSDASANSAEPMDFLRFREVLGSLKAETVNISMPKFKFETELGLGGYLQKMGMTDAFSEMLADFSGISDTFLYITAVIHKAFIEVNEEGSEAAAATAVVMGTKSVQVDIPKQFIADRPFLFAIRDLRTGSILFIGRVADPRN